jgi:hypothetical protein
MFRAPLCPSSGARAYYTSGFCLSYLVLGFQVVGIVWSWGLCVRFAGCCSSPQTGHTCTFPQLLIVLKIGFNWIDVAVCTGKWRVVLNFEYRNVWGLLLVEELLDSLEALCSTDFVNPLKSIGYYIYHQVQIYKILGSNHTVYFMCFVWIWEQTVVISPYTIYWLVFITEI